MRVKSIKTKSRLPYRLFLLLLSPLLIGIIISLSPRAHSKWEKEDTLLLKKSPESQGWAQMEYDVSPSDFTTQTVDSENL